MRIAVTYNDGTVEQNFEETTAFKIYQAVGGRVISTILEDVCGFGQGMLPAFLQDQCVDALICGKIPQEAKTALFLANISVYNNAKGNVEEVIEDFLSGHFTTR